MFVLIVENLMQPADVIGPFDHEEDAHAYGEKNYKTHLRRVVRLLAPAK